MSDNCFRTSKQLMIIIGYHTANEISQKKCIVQQWWYPVHIPDPWSRTSKHTYAAIVHYQKCSRLWSCSLSTSNAGTLSRLLRLQYEYHKCTKLWSCSPRFKKCWSMITSARSHGHVARDPHNTGTLLQVTVLMVWNGELKIALCIWSCAHDALWCIMMEPTMVACWISKDKLRVPFHLFGLTGGRFHCMYYISLNSFFVFCLWPFIWIQLLHQQKSFLFGVIW